MTKKRLIPCPRCNGAGKIVMPAATEQRLEILAEAESVNLKKALAKVHELEDRVCFLEHYTTPVVAKSC